MDAEYNPEEFTLIQEEVRYNYFTYSSRPHSLPLSLLSLPFPPSLLALPHSLSSSLSPNVCVVQSSEEEDEDDIARSEEVRIENRLFEKWVWL